MSAVHVNVDLSNPGQFFACCGIFELADRFWQGAESWFDDDMFHLCPLARPATTTDLAELLQVAAAAPLIVLDENDPLSSRIRIGEPFDVLLDWWRVRRMGISDLKVWAGTMDGPRITAAMQRVLAEPASQTSQLLNFGTVAFDVQNARKKREPFYFDARRGANARSIDVGFSTDALEMTTTCYPAVEFLALVGLQRFRPAQAPARRHFTYTTWRIPLPPVAASAAVCGALSLHGSATYMFESAYRTDQRKHKAFKPATLIKQESV